jgi:hypothetical protein
MRKTAGSAGHYDCRNNRLTQMGLETDGFADRVRAAIARYGKTRVGVFLGTSTAGILQTELAYRRRDPQTGALPDDFHYRTTHNSFSLAEFTRDYFGLQGMAMAISTACSSSAKVFAAAARQLELGSIDAAIVGGVDTLCLTTLYGFASLQLTSAQPCRPYDAARNGISVGEGPPSRCSNGRAIRRPVRSCCSAPANRATPTTCPRHTRKGWAPGWPWKPRCARPAWQPPTSATSTCTAPPRRPTMPPRARRSPRCSATPCRAVRPRAPPATRWAPPARSKR